MALTQTEIQILKYLVELGRPEAMANAKELISPTIDYENAFELVNDMNNKNLIKLVYCVSPNMINVQLTLFGEKEYQNFAEAL